ncbi:MAG: hypothetical protein HY057_14330 [Rhodospirillales bacterium]|nr:hypothetical protein [Rhodospirillales bacterium]
MNPTLVAAAVVAGVFVGTFTAEMVIQLSTQVTSDYIFEIFGNYLWTTPDLPPLPDFSADIEFDDQA